MKPIIRNFRAIAAAALLAVGSAVAPATFAQEEEVASSSTWDLEFNAGVDFTTHYFFRGIFQENEDLIVQPYASVGTTVWEGDGMIQSVSATLGTWNSIHGGPTGEDGPDDPWYESDVYLTLGFGFADHWELGVTYTALISPNNLFDTIHEIALGLSYDDSHWWGDSGFSLAPSAVVIFELDDEADGGNGAFGATGSDEGIYYAFGLEPGFILLPSHNITISFPTTLAFGCDYYEQDTNGDGAIDDDSSFGYFQTGIKLGVPLTVLSERLENWSLTAGVNFLWLGDTNEFANSGEDFETIGVVGVSVSF